MVRDDNDERGTASLSSFEFIIEKITRDSHAVTQGLLPMEQRVKEIVFQVEITRHVERKAYQKD